MNNHYDTDRWRTRWGNRDRVRGIQVHEDPDEVVPGAEERQRMARGYSRRADGGLEWTSSDTTLRARLVDEGVITPIERQSREQLFDTLRVIGGFRESDRAWARLEELEGR
ncbi:MAG TPA: hypothetical protein VFB62_10065 [Polyangiaceae bacterium]|nr:hypothetical protein [Polyangiaceae bacterium]